MRTSHRSDAAAACPNSKLAYAAPPLKRTSELKGAPATFAVRSLDSKVRTYVPLHGRSFKSVARGLSRNPIVCDDEDAPGLNAAARVHQHAAEKFALLPGLDQRPGCPDERRRRPVRIDVVHVLGAQDFAALVFGAQLCSARAGSEDNATEAQASSAVGEPTTRCC